LHTLTRQKPDEHPVVAGASNPKAVTRAATEVAIEAETTRETPADRLDRFTKGLGMGGTPEARY